LLVYWLLVVGRNMRELEWVANDQQPITNNQQPSSISSAKLEVHGVAAPSLPLSSPFESRLSKDFDDPWIHVSRSSLLVSFPGSDQ
jgi:hypothetical protein